MKSLVLTLYYYRTSGKIEGSAESIDGFVEFVQTQNESKIVWLTALVFLIILPPVGLLVYLLLGGYTHKYRLVIVLIVVCFRNWCRIFCRLSRTGDLETQRRCYADPPCCGWWCCESHDQIDLSKPFVVNDSAPDLDGTRETYLNLTRATKSSAPLKITDVYAERVHQAGGQWERWRTQQV